MSWKHFGTGCVYSFKMRHVPDPILALLAPLRRYAFALTRDWAEADDLVQDTMLRGHEQRRQLVSEKAVGPWLRSILRNRFLDRRRQQAAQIKREVDFAQLSPQVQDASQDDAIRLTQLRQFFLALPEEQREALALVAVDGLSYADAAQVIGVAPGTVMSRVSRARAKLREIEDGVQRPAKALKLVGGTDAE